MLSYLVKIGYPPLGLFRMKQFTPELIKLFCDKEVLVNTVGPEASAEIRCK